jgi:Type III restriction enzyme, res subunit
MKATGQWQDYIVRSTTSNVRIESPHHHAMAGGLLACAVLRILKHELKWQVAALHSCAAHHSFLQSLNPGGEYEKHLAPAFRSEQAKIFFTYMLRQYGHVSDLVTEQAWKRCAEMRPAPVLPSFWAQLQQEIRNLSPNEYLEIAFATREWLGEMVRLDQLSAATQSKRIPFEPQKAAVPAFKPRKPIQYEIKTDLHAARNNILAETLNLPTSRFYAIKAATGLGKTNAMISKAEQLLQEHGLRKVIYGVPTTSIGDQIFLDYLQEVNSQIWDHRRKERLEDYEDREKQTLEAAEEPFGSHYNVTTFNQVFLAMLHPQRFQCVKNEGLADAVVILDEFHKLPFHLQRPLLEAANLYSSCYNLYFILGSATAIPVDRWVRTAAIPQQVLAKIHSIPFIQERRIYHKLGKLRPAELLDTIHQLHRGKSTLAVVNLVAKGTFPLSTIIGIGANPFRRIGSLPSTNWEQVYESLPSWRGIKTLIIDSTMPPFLRKRIIPPVKSIVQSGKELLVISTQIIEAGVDLNFQTGIVDWQGLASTLQRGGRVGREGGGVAKDVYVFELIDEYRKTSYQTLKDGLSLPPVSELAKYLTPLHFLLQQEATWFHRWDSNCVFKDQDLTEQLETLVNRAHTLTHATDWREILKPKPGSQPTLGLDMAALQYLAQIYGEEEPGESIVLFESEEVYSETGKLIDSNDRRLTQEAIKRINERTINSYHSEVLAGIMVDTIDLPPLQGGVRCVLQQW